MPAGGPGELICVAPDGTRSVVLGGLDFPTSVAVGEDGVLYVTTTPWQERVK
jgi:hypothetical protein